MIETWKIGSDKSNNRVILGPDVALFHAEVRREGDKIVVRDLGSGKPTYVNEWRVRQKVLGPHDELWIGGEKIDIDNLMVNGSEDEADLDYVTVFTPRIAVGSEDAEDINAKVSEITEQKVSFWDNARIPWIICGILFAMVAVTGYYAKLYYNYKSRELIISEGIKRKYAFWEKNFTPRPVIVRNSTGKDFVILAVSGISYDSTSKGWAFQKPAEHSVSIYVTRNEIKPINVGNLRNAVAVAFYIKSGDTEFMVSRILAPQVSDFDSLRNFLDIKTPEL